MIKTELIWHNAKEENPKNSGKYLVIRDREYHSPVYYMLYFTLDSGGLFFVNEPIKKQKNVWYYYDSEYGDIVVKDVVYWTSLPQLQKIIK